MTIEEKIIKFLRQNRGTHTPKQIAQALGISYNLVKMPLRRLTIKGFVKSPVRGRYVLKVTKSNKAVFDNKNENYNTSNSFQTFIQTLPHVMVNDATKNKGVEARIKIYKLLIHGYPKSKIATILKINKATVQYHVNILEKQKIVKRTNGTKSPILYTPAQNSTTIEKNYYKNIIQKIVGDDSPTRFCRVHCDNYTFKILQPPKTEPPWHQKWSAKNTNYQEFTVLLNNWNRPVRVRQIQNNLLVIFMPEMYLDAFDLKNYENILQARVLGVATWLQKKYGYRLGLIEHYQKPHYAFPEEPNIVSLAKKFNLSASDVWMDDSDGHPEWETNDIELAKIKIEEPKLVKEIINKMKAQEETITRIIQHCPLLKPLEQRDDLKGYT